MTLTVTGAIMANTDIQVSEMSSNQFRKMLLANEIKKSKARVGMAIVDGVSKKADNEYIVCLNEVIETLQKAIDLLSQ